MNGNVITSLGDLLLPNAVVVRARWKGRKQVLAELSGVMATALGLTAREVHEAVLERERLGSTGVGEGVAIPMRVLRRYRGPWAVLPGWSRPRISRRSMNARRT